MRGQWLGHGTSTPASSINACREVMLWGSMSLDANTGRVWRYSSIRKPELCSSQKSCRLHSGVPGGTLYPIFLIFACISLLCRCFSHMSTFSTEGLSAPLSDGFILPYQIPLRKTDHSSLFCSAIFFWKMITYNSPTISCEQTSTTAPSPSPAQTTRKLCERGVLVFVLLLELHMQLCCKIRHHQTSQS